MYGKLKRDLTFSSKAASLQFAQYRYLHSADHKLFRIYFPRKLFASDSPTNTVNLGAIFIDLPRMHWVVPSFCVSRIAEEIHVSRGNGGKTWKKREQAREKSRKSNHVSLIQSVLFVYARTPTGINK